MGKSEHVKQLLETAGVEGPRGPYLAYFHFFNRQQFYEAHDILEWLWLQERQGPDNNFYKALIQLAGAFVHLQKGRVKPAAALFKLSRSYLEHYPGMHHELDVRRVIELIDDWLRRLDSPTKSFDLSGVSLTLNACH